MGKEKTSGRQRGRGCEVVKKRKREKNKLVKPGVKEDWGK